MSAAWPRPAPGDIVWCRFPHLPAMDPGPKPRPGLVLAVEDLEDGTVMVDIVYGTSQRTTQLLAGEFAILRSQHAAAYAAAGLSADTKFNMCQHVALPWGTKYFDVAPGAPFGQTPKLGILHPVMYRPAAAANAVCP